MTARNATPANVSPEGQTARHTHPGQAHGRKPFFGLPVGRQRDPLMGGAGHTFLIFLGDGFFPVNVLAAVRAVPEVCHIYCATANPTQVIVAQTGAGPRRARRGGWRSRRKRTPPSA